MKPKSIWLIACYMAIGASTSLYSSPQAALSSTTVLGSLQQAVVDAAKKAAPSLALVKVEDNNPAPKPPGSSPAVFLQGGMESGTKTTNGIILTAQGHILVPGVFKPDQDQRISVWLGENEYIARTAKVDESLGLTILKIDADGPLKPMDVTKGADLAVGEWAVALNPSEEEYNYQTQATPVVCQGERIGYYRQFKLGLLNGSPASAVVVNLNGDLVGLMDRGSVSAVRDLQQDLQRLVTEANGKSTSEEDKKKKGWFGAMLAPVNKEYAKATKLPTGALLILYVCKDSPAAAAGLQQGDFIVGLNNKPLKLSGLRTMDYFTKSLQPRTGEKFTVTALRNGKSAEYTGTFTENPETESLRAEDIGVTVSAITDKDVFSRNLPTAQGLLVTEVAKGSPAANSGSLRRMLLSKNDLIVELAGQPTPDLPAFEKALDSIRRDHPPVVLVKFYRGIATGYAGLNLTLGEKANANKQ